MAAIAAASTSRDGRASASARFRAAFVLPFAACFALTIGMLGVSDDPLQWEVGLAVALQASIGVAILRGADMARSRRVALTAIVAYLLSVALLRAGLGSTSGYGALVMLPVMWAAFTGRLLELVVALACMVGLVLAPLLVDGVDDYPEVIWRGGVFTLALASTLGLAIHALIRRLDDELRHSATILSAMSEGLVVTRDSEIVSVNPAFCAMIGLPADAVRGQRPPYSFWPADQETGAELRRRIAADGGGDFEAELERPDGGRFPVAVTATPLDLGDGSVAFLNTVRDITAQHDHEQAIERNARQLEAIAEVTRAVGHTDPFDANLTICRIGLDVCDGAHTTAIWERNRGGELVITSSYPERERPLVVRPNAMHGTRIVSTTGEPLFVADALGSIHCDQRVVEELSSASVLFQPIVGPESVLGVLVVNWPERLEALPVEIAPLLQVLADEAALALQRADLLERLDSLTRTDELTGLPNRRAWDEVLERELGHAARRARPLSVAMLDLDHFKDYNDERGHLRGDQLLRATAAAWRARLRSTDMLARWGGEEFALLLPDCHAEAAVRLIERLRGSLPDGITFSAGVAEWYCDASADELVHAADRAMYAAKQAGRDRIELFAGVV